MECWRKIILWSLMTLLPNQSFPVISLTKHNLTLILTLNIVLRTTHLAGLIVHSSGLSKFSWIPVEVIIELLNCFISLLLTLGIQDCKIFSLHLSFNFLNKMFSLCNTYFKPFWGYDQKNDSPISQPKSLFYSLKLRSSQYSYKPYTLRFYPELCQPFMKPHQTPKSQYQVTIVRLKQSHRDLLNALQHLCLFSVLCSDHISLKRRG